MNDLKKRLEILKKKLDLDELEEKIKAIEKESAEPDFWQDHQRASQKMKQMADWQKEIEEIEELEKFLAEGKEKEAENKLKKVEIKAFFSGPYDRSNIIFSIHAGQGGTEAMDWTEMLKRMYLKYFDQKGWRYQIIDEVMGEEAGVKSVAMKVSDSFVYGYLKHEAGTHRLVRQSPFNADHLRQTSFALVEVLPQIGETTEIEIKEDDLDWQFFRSSTQGGQNVQKVSTAVRLKHKPTGITVTSQVERYQEQNRKMALDLLRSKLWAREQERVEKEKKRLKKGRTKAAWGTQIRSYVLHPYKMVKDLRTDYETSDVDSILDGNLDGFIEAEVRELSV
jgi:peptide chain release factor 2